MLKGIPAAPGISIGKAFLFDTHEAAQMIKRPILEEEATGEIRRFKEALAKTKHEISKIKERISREIGAEHGEIFSAHILVLEDAILIDEVINRVRKERIAVESIFQDVLAKYIKAFSKIDDEYLRERISDINDVGRRVLKNLIGAKYSTLSELKGPVIVIAYDLSPSDTATMHKDNVIAFATDIGGRTSHTAIMAKSLEIPAVVGLEEVTSVIRNNDHIIVDGNKGIVIVHPGQETIRTYEIDKKRFEERERGLLSLRDSPAETLDGHKIDMVANIELPEEIPSVIYHGAQGIGLYRTEYFYMNRADLPSEQEQYEAYKSVAQKMAPHPVIIRTLDLGGDKFLSHLEVPPEMNPFLGWRAIRFCLARPDIFKVQLRAILKASVHGRLKVMYPLISGLGELRQANVILSEVGEELRSKNIPFDENIEVGAMIEIPSAAITSDTLAKEVDFFSIGTNDLIQYSIAVDRVNEKIAYLYESTHPAILRLIKNIIDNGHKEGIWVGMCGEMAGELELVPILLGFGLDEFSMSSVLIPEVKKIIRSLTMAQAKEIAEKAITLSTGKEIEEFARAKLREILPDTEIK
ncbi:MAG: phosphoenolpyruvate--protein phosphotransferase [Candidatus Omnitrophica bacterium]|nr:phosphoenolpyruvate--protein phosphotransferase [Candidatus Omnitrophota bacterium]